MSSTNQPFGLVPSFHPTGLDRAVALTDGIASGYSSNILKGQPVALNSSGVIVAATAGSAYQGAFAGVQWTDTTGRFRVSNYWPASTTYITGSCVAYYYSDPNIVYAIQADGSLAQTSIGDQANFSNITAGSTTTGLSQCTLNASGAVGNGVQGQLRVVDLSQNVDNAWGDAFTVVRVVVSQSQFFGAFTAVA
jgi:hypothetical protein